jgi:hypothetical protein
VRRSTAYATTADPASWTTSSTDRLGHEMDGIKATYSHVSDLMRENLKQALQTRH